MSNYFISAIIAAAVSISSFFGLQHEKPLTPQMQEAIHQYVQQSIDAPQVGSTLPIAGQTYNLSGAGVSQTATSITLASFTLPQNGYKIQDADLSDTFYITLEPGNSTRQEIVSCTTDVQNVNGSATFSGCTRGLSPVSPYTASTSLRFSHGGGTQVIFSNPPQFYNQFAILGNTNAFTGANTFSSTVTFTNSPTLSNDCTVASANSAVCAKAYIDGVAVAGASNANDTTKGIVETATAAEASAGTSAGSTGARLALGANLSTSTCQFATNSVLVSSSTTGKLSGSCLDTSSNEHTWGKLQTFTSGITTNGAIISNSTATLNATTTLATTTKAVDFDEIATMVASTTLTGNTTPQPVYIGTTTGAVGLVDANASTTFDFIGFALSNALNGQNVLVQVDGIVTGFSGLTRGAEYFVSNTAGVLAATPGDGYIPVGRAISPTEILMNRRSEWFLGKQTLASGANTVQAGTADYATSAVIDCSSSGSGGTASNFTFTIHKYGQTSATVTDVQNIGGNIVANCSATWNNSTNVLTISASDTFNSATAYYYR